MTSNFTYFELEGYFFFSFMYVILLNIVVVVAFSPPIPTKAIKRIVSLSLSFSDSHFVFMKGPHKKVCALKKPQQYTLKSEKV